MECGPGYVHVPDSRRQESGVKGMTGRHIYCFPSHPGPGLSPVAPSQAMGELEKLSLWLHSPRKLRSSVTEAMGGCTGVGRWIAAFATSLLQNWSALQWFPMVVSGGGGGEGGHIYWHKNKEKEWTAETR